MEDKIHSDPTDRLMETISQAATVLQEKKGLRKTPSIWRTCSRKSHLKQFSS